MPELVPPHLAQSFQLLQQAIQGAEGKEVDLLTASWADIEKAVIKLLGGAFQVQDPNHQQVALGLAAALGGRFQKEHQAFWFPSRESPEGAAIGFPEAVIYLSPFGAVLEALSRANLSELDRMTSEIRRSLAEARFAPAAPGARPTRLSARDYQHLFDPGMVQFAALDANRAKEAWEAPVSRLTRDVRDALSRAAAKIPAEMQKPFEMQVVGALSSLDPTKPLIQQIGPSTRVAELMGHLFATKEVTGAGPEEFWDQIALPLLYVGAPASFPPVTAEDIEEYGEGADPMLVFLDVVPYQTSAAEEGLLGVFSPEDIQLPHPGFSQATALRMLVVDKARLAPMVATFDPARTQDAVKRFIAHVKAATGKDLAASRDGEQLLNLALTLLKDLKRVVESVSSRPGQVLAIRHLTEAEAAGEASLAPVRDALQGPKIILA